MTQPSGQTYSFFRTRRWFRASWTYSRFSSRVFGSSPSSFRLSIMELILNGPFLMRDPKKKNHTSGVPPLPPPGTAGRSSLRPGPLTDWLSVLSAASAALSCLISPHETSRATQGYYHQQSGERGEMTGSSRLWYRYWLVEDKRGGRYGYWLQDLASNPTQSDIHFLHDISSKSYHSQCVSGISRLFNSFSDLILR